LNHANDTASLGPNPIDDAQTFVAQNYRDFLNREPDAGGLAFWRVPPKIWPMISETEPRTELKGPRTAGTEHLAKTRARLTEGRGIVEIAAVLNQVRGVEEIEDFA